MLGLARSDSKLRFTRGISDTTLKFMSGAKSQSICCIGDTFGSLRRSARFVAVGHRGANNQDEAWQAPDADELLTGREMAERYYIPLSKSDLLADQVHLQTEVLAIGRGDLLKSDMSGEDRAFAEFRMLVRDDAASPEPAGRRIVLADVVIDATGTFSGHNWLGEGGIPALGELSAQRHIDYGIPDILGADRPRFAHRHTLVVGDGHAAATSVAALDRLSRDAPYTQITWAVRRESGSGGPIRRIPGDPWPARDRLAESANQLIQSVMGHLTFFPATAVQQIIWHEGLEKFQVGLSGEHGGEIEVDRVIAAVGIAPTINSLPSCKWAKTRFVCSNSAWPPAGEQPPDRHLLATAEPDFYVLGARVWVRFAIYDCRRAGASPRIVHNPRRPT